ncbi:MAG: NAD-dependent epimerase/dehydratase family protein [Planctomycetota bacterium]|nr:NAD-dependent epimerase/dehydratase family protein [Planctomycetota bacterium]
MRALVTGGTGFIGGHLVRVLLRQGTQVRILHRPTSDTSTLGDLPVDWIPGDLSDPASLKKAVHGMDLVFHLAADLRMAVPRPRRMHRTNVDGTVELLRAARDAGVSRIVCTSSAVTVKCSEEHLGSERDFVEPGECRSTYQLTKVLAERAVWEMIRDGAPITIVNPSTVIGGQDRRPTPTGRLIADFLEGRLPGYLDALLNWVCVEDVAMGHWLAATKGRVGERYLLCKETLTLAQFLQILSDVADRPMPAMKIPYAVAYLAGIFGTAWTRLTHREPQATLDGVRMAAMPMRYDGSKAREELELPQTPIRTGVERAVEWFRSDEYATRGGSR